jgi:hypothetical protein
MNILLWLLLVGLTTNGLAQGPQKGDATAEKLVKYCRKHNPKIDSDYLRFVTAESRRILARVHHEDKLETLLSMFYVESKYIQNADDGDSYGIAQTRKRYEHRLRIWWYERGLDLGSIDDPTAQIAFGVAEFVEHWYYARKSRNRLWETVRRYNGSGPKARLHAEKVFRARKAIFGA